MPRILVIEDEPQLARHVTGALRRSGHEPAAQRDGAEGLREAENASAQAYEVYRERAARRRFFFDSKPE